MRSRRPQGEYHAVRVSRNRVHLLACLLLAGIAGSFGGCSLTMHIASLQVDDEPTGSIPAQVSPVSAALDEEDWRRAQAALNLAVDPQGPGLSVNWDNPASKNRGHFVQSGQLALVENTVCRPFLAVVIAKEKGETRHEGNACRTGPGEWTIRDIRPIGPVTAKAATIDQTMPARAAPLLLSKEQQ